MKPSIYIGMILLYLFCSLLSTGWFQGRIQAWFYNQTDNILMALLKIDLNFKYAPSLNTCIVKTKTKNVSINKNNIIITKYFIHISSGILMCYLEAGAVEEWVKNRQSNILVQVARLG